MVLDGKAKGKDEGKELWRAADARNLENVRQLIAARAYLEWKDVRLPAV